MVKKVTNTIPLADKGTNTATVATSVMPEIDTTPAGQLQKNESSATKSSIASRLSGLVDNALVTGADSLMDSYGSLAHLQGDSVPSLSASQADTLIEKNNGKINYLRVVESNNQLVRQGINTATSFVRVEEAAWKFGGAVVDAKEAKATTLHKETMHTLNNEHRGLTEETAGYRNQRAGTVRDKAKAKVAQREDIQF